MPTVCYDWILMFLPGCKILSQGRMLPCQWILPIHLYLQVSIIQSSQDSLPWVSCWFLPVPICQILQLFWCRMSRHSISWLDLTPVIGNERRTRSDLEEDKHCLMKHLFQIWPWQHFHIRGIYFTLERGYSFFLWVQSKWKDLFFPILYLFPISSISAFF